MKRFHGFLANKNCFLFSKFFYFSICSRAHISVLLFFSVWILCGNVFKSIFGSEMEKKVETNKRNKTIEHRMCVTFACFSFSLLILIFFCIIKNIKSLDPECSSRWIVFWSNGRKNGIYFRVIFECWMLKNYDILCFSSSAVEDDKWNFCFWWMWTNSQPNEYVDWERWLSFVFSLFSWTSIFWWKMINDAKPINFDSITSEHVADSFDVIQINEPNDMLSIFDIFEFFLFLPSVRLSLFRIFFCN